MAAVGDAAFYFFSSDRFYDVAVYILGISVANILSPGEG